MTLLDRIKYIASKKGISISNIEKDLGFSNKAIYRWNNSDPSISKVIAVANYLEVNLEWLATGKESVGYFQPDDITKEFIEKYNKLSDENKTNIAIFMNIATISSSKIINVSNEELDTTRQLHDNSIAYTVHKNKYVPILGKVAAGIPITLVEEYMEQIEAPSNDVDFATIANGESMEPVIHDGENIFIESMQTLDNGEIGVFDIDGETTCKRFKYDFKTKTVTLTSFNSAFKPLIYPLKNYQDTFRIIGKVILTDEQEERYHQFIFK